MYLKCSTTCLNHSFLSVFDADSTEYNANFEINGRPIKDHVWGGYTEGWKKGLDAASLHQNPDFFFFFEHDLRKGKHMTLDLKDSYIDRFLPREVAQSIPFSTNQFYQILTRFSLTPDSQEAKVLKKTLERCEMHDHVGEDMICATSLEAMVDFVKTQIGNEVEILSNKKVKGQYGVQDYTVAGEVMMMLSSNEGKARMMLRLNEEENLKSMVTCHKMNYAYAVFKCHKTKNTRVYVVPLVGEDGAEVEAVAICHTDTSKWNPRHFAFLALGVKRGTVPICHFLPEDDVIWFN